MSGPLAAYEPFLAAIEHRGILRLGVQEHIAVARIVAAAQAGQWSRGELGDALASALATSADKWQDLRRLYDRCVLEDDANQPAVVPPARSACQRPPPDRSLLSAARHGARALRRHKHWVALLLLVSVYFVGERKLRDRPPPTPLQEYCLPLVAEKTRPDSRYLKRPLPVSAASTAPKVQPVRVKLLSPSLSWWVGYAAGAAGLCLLGTLLMTLWPHLRRRLQALQDAAAAAEQERRQQEEAQLRQAQALREPLELSAYGSGQNIRPYYRLELQPPIADEIIEDTATLLGRIYQAARGRQVDVSKTLRATIQAGGQPRLVLRPRRRATGLLVLYDVWDTQPYLPGFLKLLDRWQRLGVRLSRWRFEKNPRELRPPDSERRIKLEDLLLRYDDPPVLIFASKLYTRGLDEYHDWPRSLRQVTLRAWLDPDPRPAEHRTDDETRQAIALLAPLLPRFALTATGLKALARFLQQQGRGAVIPGWEPLEVSAQTAPAIEKWLALGAQVPDASYEQWEAMRQRLLSAELPDPRAMRLLIERLEAELGAGYRPHVPTVELDDAQQVKLQRWLKEAQPELYDQGLALLDQTLGDTPPGMESGKPTLLTWEWMWRKLGYKAKREARLEDGEQVLLPLAGTPAHEAGQQLRQQVRAIHAATGQSKPEALPPQRLGWREAQVPGFLARGFLAAAPAAALAVGVVLWAVPSPWVAERMPTQAVKVTIERIQDYQIEKAEFPATMYRPALVPIPAGMFTMGSPKDEEGRFPGEEQHQVEITQRLLVMETEVTQGQYRAAMGEEPAKTRKTFYSDIPSISNQPCQVAGVSEDRPVYCVDWFDATKYANRLSELEGLEKCYRIQGTEVQWPQKQGCKGYRLPTEAEWEHAARAGQKYPYAGSDSANEVAWYSETAKGGTQPVKHSSKKPNAWGLHDMSGNVYEWVWDWYASYPAAPQKDPVGPLQDGSFRVIRGGSWGDDARGVRVANRNGLAPGIRDQSVGFRLVRSYP